MAMGLSIGIGIPNGELTFNQGGGLDGTSFITTWRTTTSNETITIPTNGSGYNYNITTSDGQSFTSLIGSKTITFATAGDYDVSISGDFPSIYFANVGDKTKLIDIKQWGNIVWKSFERAFRGCSNLVGSFTDAPNLTNVTDFSRIFQSCSSFNQPIGDWDVSNVTGMAFMFNGASSFNQPIGDWVVSNVTNVFSMFQAATSFDHPLNNWDISSLTTTSRMFFNATAFNQDLNNWDISNITSTDLMFRGASSFNQDLSDWNIINVTNFNDFARSTTFSTTNYDAILIGWEATLQATFPNGSGYTPTISINFGNSEYAGGGAAATARASLVSNFNWTITDGGIS